jgi:hypothetical protein
MNAFARFKQGGELHGPTGNALDYANNWLGTAWNLRDVAHAFTSNGIIPVHLTRCTANPFSQNRFGQVLRLLSVEAFDCRAPLPGQSYRWFAGHLTYLVVSPQGRRTIYSTRYITSTQFTDKLCEIFALDIQQTLDLKQFLNPSPADNEINDELNNDFFVPSICLIDILDRYADSLIETGATPSPSSYTRRINRILSASAFTIVQSRVQILVAVHNSTIYSGGLQRFDKTFVLQDAESVLLYPATEPGTCAHTGTNITCPGPIVRGDSCDCALFSGIFRTICVTGEHAYYGEPRELAYSTTESAVRSTSYSFQLNTDTNYDSWEHIKHVGDLHHPLYVPSDLVIVDSLDEENSQTPPSPSYNPYTTPPTTPDTPPPTDPDSPPSERGSKRQRTG